MAALKVLIPAFVILLSIWILLSGIGYHKVYLDNQWPLERYEERQNGTFYFDHDAGILKSSELSYLGSYKKTCNYGLATKPFCFAKISRYIDFEQINTTKSQDCVLELQYAKEYAINSSGQMNPNKPPMQIDLKCFDNANNLIYIANYLEKGRKDPTPNYYMIDTLIEKGYIIPDAQNPVSRIIPKN